MTLSELVEYCVVKILEQQTSQEARRLFHGRGHMFPGFEHLVVNWYPPYLLVASFNQLSEGTVAELVEAFVSAVDREGIVLAGIGLQKRDGRRTTTDVVWGEVPDEHIVTEGGLRYVITPKRNQNVGLFMDMAHVREYLAGRVRGASVLNLFAYTCAFSVSAIAHGAEKVVNNDMSANALKQGERNHLLNEHDLRNVRMLPHNVFKSWWKIRQFGPYDILIIDPPTNQRGSFVAEKSYGQILKRIPELAKDGAKVIACLNSPFLGPDFLTQQMQRWCPDAHFDRFLPAHPDFPDKFPERALKVAEFVYRT